jgi:hypothetical protein
MMKDKCLVGFAPMSAFSTAEWGVLFLKDGKVTLNVEKAFNQARRVLDAGANYFRILRRGAWGLPAGGAFDWDTPGYFDIFRQYLEILHQPRQGAGLGVGADVLLELFDLYDDPAKRLYEQANWGIARAMMRRMFSELGHLPWLKFGVGNELNHDFRDFVLKVVFDEFKEAGKMPFSYGATYSSKDDWLEKEKALAAIAWKGGLPDFTLGDAVAEHIYRQVHGVKDQLSPNLVEAAGYWVTHPLCVIFGVDGVFDGASDCDWALSATGKIQRRPSPAQWGKAVGYVLNYKKANGEYPAYALTKGPYKGQVKFGFEYLPKAINADECSAKGVLAISQEYHTKWGTWPENYGKYTDDWVEPIPPGPEPVPPEPGPIPPPEPPKSCYEKFIAGRPFWKWQIGAFLKCLFG